MGFKEYDNYDGLGLAELVRKGEVSAAELTEEAISRVEAHNPALNAVVHNAYDSARATAKNDLPDGPFKGVPFLIKDLGIKVKGMPRTDGTWFIKDDPDTEDSRLTKRYRESGVVFLGKTNTPEFGITGTTESARLKPCRNPWNTDHISGGSSGGAASSVAAGIVPLAHASDGLGSIRIPAACCGLVGMKITRDRNPQGPHDGDRVIGFSVDHVVSRTVRDSAAMLDATAHHDPDSPYPAPPKPESYLKEVSTPPGALRIGFYTETPSGNPVDPHIRAAVEDVAKQLESLGHKVEERGLGINYRHLYAAQRAVSGSNFAAAMHERIKRMGRQPEEHELEPLTWRNWKGSEERLTAVDVGRGWRTLREMNRQILANWLEVDVMLSPVLGTSVPKIGYCDPVNQDPRTTDEHQAKTFPFTPPYNFTGQPSLSLPLAWDDQGLPIGMMFTGRYGDEATLYRLAGQLEEARPWKNKRPPVWGAA